VTIDAASNRTPAAGRPRAATPGELAFYGACRAIAVGASWLYYPGPVVGAEHIPKTGSFILAPTHRSYIDWLIAARVTRRRLRYLVKAEVWKSKAAGRLVEALGGFPVQRGAADRHAFTLALSVLATGEPLVVFPEGTRQRGPEITTLQDGAAYLALRAWVPIVPVALGGTEAAMPRGASMPRPGRVRIVVGEPISPGDFPWGLAEGSARVPRAATRALSEVLRARLQALLDQSEGRGPARGATEQADGDRS
jgi:1-acyl-sn-glycerol-3-phosphate acyltransferase